MTHAGDIMIAAVAVWVVGRLLINYHYWKKQRHNRQLLNDLSNNGDCNGS
jgi:hypothetical protein